MGFFLKISPLEGEGGDGRRMGLRIQGKIDKCKI
jgi:hypothetical protein